MLTYLKKNAILQIVRNFQKRAHLVSYRDRWHGNHGRDVGRRNRQDEYDDRNDHRGWQVVAHKMVGVTRFGVHSLAIHGAGSATNGITSAPVPALVGTAMPMGSPMCLTHPLLCR